MSEKIEIIKNIDFDFFINNKKNQRKVTISDIMENKIDKPVKHLPNKKKIKKSRMQAEYGEKKFIKP